VPPDPLSRRERQIMDVVHRLGSGTVADVRAQLDDPPTYSTVRALMNTLESKGHLRHEQRGRAYVYAPTVEPEVARTSALRRVVDSFFGGSPTDAAVALLGMSGDLDDAAQERLQRLIEQAREEGR
jgi:predicted transcriptional regulator